MNEPTSPKEIKIMLAEELKAKLALEDRNRNRKIQALKELDTLKLINMLPELQDKLEAVLREEASFRNLNIGFLASGDRDCAEAKRISAELTLTAISGTAKDKEAWLTKQRTENDELARAIARQHDVGFNLENMRIDIEMSKKKLENVHKILALRTAQIQFLTEH